MKKVKLVQGENNSQYLVSDDKIVLGDEVCELLTTGGWLPMTVHTLNDIDVERQKKIIMYGDDIGYIYDNHETSSVHYRKISQNDIVEILGDDVNCYLDMTTFEGDYCGFRIPHLIDNKVVIIKGV
jgi:hypothetical protein